MEYGSGTCYSTDQVVVTVDALPVINLLSDDVFCVNDGDISLTTFTPTGGTWEGTGVSDAQSGIFDAGTGVGVYDLFYWYTDPLTQCSDTVSHQVTVQDIPVVNAGPDIALCNQNISEQLVGFSPGLGQGGTGLFYGIGDAEGHVTPTGSIVPSDLGVGTYDVVYEFTSSTTNCTNTDTLTVVITDPIVADAGLDTVVCYNAPHLQLEGYSPTVGVHWYGITPVAEAAIIDDVTGLINPQLLPPGSYTYEMEYGSGTCYSTDQVVVTVDPLPVIDLGEDEDFCGNLMIEVLSPATPAGGYWFGDIITNPDLGYINTDVAQGQLYDVFYTYTDSQTMCSDTLGKVVSISPVPEAAFANDTLGCNNLGLPITQLSVGANQFEWDFGNSEVLFEESPEYIYPEIGNYTITLYAENSFGCIDTATSEVEITHPPIAQFIPSPYDGCAPLSVDIENTSTAPYSVFEWITNGQTYNLDSVPSQMYVQGDSILNYSISLAASNICGSDLYIDSVSVLPQPQVSFLLLNDSACSPYTAELLNTSVGLPDEYYWEYGNGQYSLNEIPIDPTYTADSLTTIYTIVLYGENECGLDSATAEILIEPNTIQSFFSTNVTSGCPPLQLEIEDLSVATSNVTYEFGDGNFSLDPDVTYTYADEGDFILTQYATNGCSYDTSEVVISVYPQPEFTLSTDSLEYCEGEMAIFQVDAVNTGDIDWDFGDGQFATGLTVTHEFENDGIYEVEATVQSSLWGCVGSESVTIEITPTPELDVQLNDVFGCSPLIVEFENQSTDADFWLWSFGDQTPNSVETSPSHSFTNYSNNQVSYNVTLQASTINGCTSSTGMTVDVLPQPVADFELTDEILCGTPSVSFTINNSQLAEQYVWFLNGDTISTEFNPDIEFSTYGYQSIQLSSSNEFDCVSYHQDIIEVHELPMPAVFVSPNSGCAPLEVGIADMSQNSVQTIVSVGGSGFNLYTGPPPSSPLNILHSGTYVVNMIATSAEGCTNELQVPELIWVWPDPYVDFDIVPVIPSELDPTQSHPSNSEFYFQNLSSGYYSSYWDFGNGTTSTLENPQYEYPYAGQYPVTLTAVSEYGCTNTHTEFVIISNELEFYVPNAFTPTNTGRNSLGINDAWRPEFSDLEMITEYHIQVFDRWGDLVWESYDPEEYWIGNNIIYGNGEHFCQNGLYKWKLVVSSNTWIEQEQKEFGHVLIVR